MDAEPKLGVSSIVPIKVLPSHTSIFEIRRTTRDQGDRHVTIRGVEGSHIRLLREVAEPRTRWLLQLQAKYSSTPHHCRASEIVLR